MKIKSIQPFIQKMALTKPYTIAYNTFTHVELVFLQVELDNGIIGIGSGSPAEDVVGENAQQTLLNLQSAFVQALAGRDIRHYQQLMYEAALQFPKLPGTLAAIDIALHDAFGKYLGISVAALYGQKIKALPTSVTIGIMNVSETLEQAEEYKKLGFKILKVKTGLQVDEDIERIEQLNKRFGNTFKIRVDANQGYTIQHLQQFITATKHLSVELIEQPLPVGKEAELLLANTGSTNIIASDESIKDAKAALRFAAPPQPFGIYNIKLMKCGGIMGAFEIATIARNANIDLFWGCNDESIISITAALHAAYACANTKYIDLEGSFDLAEDLVTGGFSLQDRYMLINERPGFGTEFIQQ